MPLPEFIQKQISDQTKILRLPVPFELECEASLPEVDIAYRTWGDASNAAHGAILICHALTGSADVDAWWPEIIGPGKAFDPASDFIICSNILGSCYGTTGPLSANPATGDRYRGDFPAVSIRDMVELQRLLLDALGVQKIAVITGPSLGGMQALEWAISYPDRIGAVVPIGVGGRHSAWCIGVSEAQRAAIAADPNWKGGFYSDDAPPTNGLAAARMMAVCTYRSWQSFDERFGRDRREQQFEVQSYLQYQGAAINRRFDANTYVGLTHAMHSHDLSRGRGRYPEILETIEQPALVVSVSTDALYPPQEQQILADHLPNARYEVLSSSHGHDGFLIEAGALGEMISSFRRDVETQGRRVQVSSGRE
jgi:homoserine O-acetyltransferase/O-succinyltransferase